MPRPATRCLIGSLHPRLGFPWLGLLLLGFFASPARAAEPPVAAQPVDFAREIRPLLSAACFACHGPDAEHREADLRLDTRAGAVGPRGPFVPGEPAESEALRRILSRDPAEQMPPPESGKSLARDEIELLRRWVEQGAPWSDHWAFTPPARPPLPEIANDSWVRNPIDRFLLARLEREGLSPSPPAEPAVLLRRASFDLTGLPPTLEQLAAVESSPVALESQFEELLASPHYGERWARWWLDAARYADSDGFEKDKPRSVWFYRDWVIDAFNRDLPYDRFIVEQIAGDLLPEADQHTRVATGFLRNSMINEEGGIDPEQFRMEAMFDRLDAVGRSILGLTLQCAQCHNHKYDPLSQVEYYGLFAFLNNCHEAQITVYTKEEEPIRREVLQGIEALEAELRERHVGWREEAAAWEKLERERKEPAWETLALAFNDTAAGGQKFLPQPDGSYRAAGYSPVKNSPQAVGRTALPRVTAIRLELLTDPNLPHGGPGRSITGTCALTEFELQAAPAETPGKFSRVEIASATADVNPAPTPLAKSYDDRSNKPRVTGPIDFALDGDPLTAWGIDLGPGRRNLPREAVFRFAKPIENPGGTLFRVVLKQQHGGWNNNDNQNHNIGRLRISVTAAEEPAADPVPRAVRDALAVAPESRTAAQEREIFSYWRTTRPEFEETNEQIEALWKRHPEGHSQLVLQERRESRPTHRLDRGDFLQARERVSPGVPALLHSLPEGAPADRLTFARWLVDRRSPTTARAVVNRVWQAYFGIGLVETSEDLGSQGTAPSHPELLDWLAFEFMENGWSFKHLHRLILDSAAYRQASRVSPELYERDPYNRLVARGPRVRVEAEMVRDAALAASGLLDRQVGGPSVYPPAPAFLFLPPASYGTKVWPQEQSEGAYRRAIYTFRYRSVPYPALEAFDAPNADTACVRRARSNTPLQALTTLNEPLFLECARELGLRALRDGGEDDRARLAFACRRVLAREPTAEEQSLLLGLLDRTRAHFGEAGRDPWLLAQPVAERRPKDVSAIELAAWTTLARVLLNLDEAITKE